MNSPNAKVAPKKESITIQLPHIMVRSTLESLATGTYIADATYPASITGLILLLPEYVFCFFLGGQLRRESNRPMSTGTQY